MTRCIFCDDAAVERGSCSFHLYTAPALEEIERALADAERRGMVAVVRHLLASAVITAQQADVELRAIESGWVRVEERT